MGVTMFFETFLMTFGDLKIGYCQPDVSKCHEVKSSKMFKKTW